MLMRPGPMSTPPGGAFRGFTLLEVLIALVILGFGFLGAGKLLMMSVKANDSAYMRTVATELAYSMMDTIRANRAAALTGSYSVTPVTIGSYTNTLAGSTSCYNTLSSSQSATTVATCDINQWEYQLALRLPSGTGYIYTGVGTVTINIQWDDTRAQCVMQSQGNCSTNSAASLNTGGISLTSSIQ